MRIFVTAKPNADEEKIEKIDSTNFRVAVKAPPVLGRANTAITKALAIYFNVPQTNVRIVSGYTSRQKIIEILQ